MSLVTFSCVSTRFKDLKADATPFSTMIVRARNLWCAILKTLRTGGLRITWPFFLLTTPPCRRRTVVVRWWWVSELSSQQLCFENLNLFPQIDPFALLISLINDHNLCIAYCLTIQGQSGKFNQCKAWWWRLSLVLEGKVLQFYETVECETCREEIICLI